MTPATPALRSVLKSQYHAALAMPRETIARCPVDVWSSAEHMNAFWQITYHTQYFTHLYLQRNEAAFRLWQHHQGDVQHPDGIPGPADPASVLPLLPAPYTQAQVLEYWTACDRMVDEAVDALDLERAESGFSWYRVSKLEHQLINIRHIQHHAAQLADRLCAADNVGVRTMSASDGCQPCTCCSHTP